MLSIFFFFERTGWVKFSKPLHALRASKPKRCDILPGLSGKRGLVSTMM